MRRETLTILIPLFLEKVLKEKQKFSKWDFPNFAGIYFLE